MEVNRGHEPAGCLVSRPSGTLSSARSGGEGRGEEVDGEGQGQGATATSPVLHYFGDYELLEEIARGGMGAVYRARQVSLNRVVAVKVLLFGQFASDEFVRRFRTEAEAAANLHHPNIVAIHEVGEHEGRQYFSMDYVEGGHLGDLAREQPLPANRAAALLKTIAEAVHHAHQRGVLHRDLKPSNILIDTEGQPRVTDFGLAKRLPDKPETRNPKPEIDLTLTGQMLGTPKYASPEQIGGHRDAVTTASDVYSLGAVLYFLLTGRTPFFGESLEQTLDRVLHSEPVAPHLLNPSVPRDLETVCLKCLEKEPRRRYSTARELSEELGRLLNDEPILARPVGAMEKLTRWCRRKPALAALVAALLVVGGAGLAGILLEWRRAERHATSETAHRLRAEEAVTMLELQRAEDLMEKDEIVMGMAYLARIVRQQPTNRIAAQRLLSALTQRNFALPVGPPLPHGKKVCYAEFSPDGRHVVTASLDLGARVWEVQTGKLTAGPMQHRDGVRFAHFSPDGTRLVTVSDEFQAYLWDAATGRSVGRPLMHSNRVRTAQFSLDGQRVLTASDDGTARLWDARTGEQVLEPLTHQQAVRWARISPDGKRIVTASNDKTAQVWESQTARPIGKPCQHDGPVVQAEFSPDSRRLVTASYSWPNFSARVWDAASGEPLTEPYFPGYQIASAQFSPDGERILVALHDGRVQIFNARDWKPVSAPMWHSSRVTAAEYGPEGQRVFTASDDHSARLWDVATGLPLTSPIQHDGLVWSGRLSPDGSFAVTASADQTARLWDVRLGCARSQILSHLAPVWTAEFSPDGESVITGSDDNTARLWNVRTGRPRGLPLRHQSRVQPVRFSPDGLRVATAARDGTARVWDAGTGQPVTLTLQHKGRVVLVEFSPDGRWLATGSEDATVRLWDLTASEPQERLIQHRSTVTCLCFSPDGQRLLSSDDKEDQVQVRDFSSGRLLAQTPAREGTVHHAEFSPDGRRVLTASEDGTTRIWNADMLQPLTEPMRHKARVNQGHFSRDGRWVVTASTDTTAQVWDSQTGEPVGEPLRHRRSVNMAEFSPDGLLVLTASEDGTARLWDAQTGRPVAEPFEHESNVTWARFSPDGRRVLTASYSGSAHIWDVPITSFEIRNPKSEIRNSELLADLAETIIGKRVNAQGALESVSPAGQAQIRQRVAELPRDADFTRWLEWFFADRSTRTISPYSQITMPEYIGRRLEEKTVAAAREAVLLAPTNAVALAHLAEMLLTSPGSKAPVTVAEAQFLLRRSETLAPGDPRVQPTRQRIKQAFQQPSIR